MTRESKQGTRNDHRIVIAIITNQRSRPAAMG